MDAPVEIFLRISKEHENPCWVGFLKPKNRITRLKIRKKVSLFYKKKEKKLFHLPHNFQLFYFIFCFSPHSPLYGPSFFSVQFFFKADFFSTPKRKKNEKGQRWCWKIAFLSNGLKGVK